MAKEASQKQQISLIAEMQKRKDLLDANTEAVSTQIKNVLKQQEEFEQSRIQLMLDTEVLLKLEQGLVEIEESPVVTDLQNCQFLTKHVVCTLRRTRISPPTDEHAHTPTNTHTHTC